MRRSVFNAEHAENAEDGRNEGNGKAERGKKRQNRTSSWLAAIPARRESGGTARGVGRGNPILPLPIVGEGWGEGGP